MKNTSDEINVHLVLGGGGVLCLSYAGALNTLYENGVRFSSVSCCSAGTFIGALLCTRGTPEGLIEDARRISGVKLLGRRALPVPDFLYGLIPGLLAFNPLLRWPFARYRQPGFSEAFEELVGISPTFEELKIQFATAGFDTMQRRFLVYASDSHPKMKVSEALAISVSWPFAYPPHERDGRIVLDAGIASECPVWMAADRYADHPIVALRPLRRAVPGTHPTRVEDFLAQAFGSAIRGLDDYVMLQMPRVKLIEIDCGDVRGDQFNLTRADKEALISAGRRAAEDRLEEFGNDLRKVSIPDADALLGKPDDVQALQHGAMLMTRFHQDLSKEVSNRVFICYSHHDKVWRERVKQAFGGTIPISAEWDDTSIAAGERWRDEIDNALNRSSVAVLLLSRHFFASEFIATREVPAIDAATRNRGLKVFPIVVSTDGWNASDFLFQACNKERPLDGLSEAERDELLEDIARRIREELKIG